jgi:predicted nucleic acid-binding protein
VTYLLDTNVVSELRKAGDGRADVNVVRWLSDEDAGRFYLSAITVMELDLGIRLVERRDPVQGKRLRTWMDSRVMTEFADRVLPVDIAVAFCCAGLHVPDPRSERDAFIAATALVHGLTIVTRNVADFRPTGVRIVDPWAAPVPPPAP